MECQRKGISVPGDIAVAGFGSFEISNVCVPTITTIDAKPKQIGFETGKLLGGLLRNGEEPEVKVTVAPEIRLLASA